MFLGDKIRSSVDAHQEGLVRGLEIHVAKEEGVVDGRQQRRCGMEVC